MRASVPSAKKDKMLKRKLTLTKADSPPVNLYSGLGVILDKLFIK